MTTTPIHVFARWKVKEGNKQTVLQLLKDLRSKTVSEKGNLFYKVHQSREEANTLILFEGYANEAAQKEHINSDHFVKLAIEQIIPLLEEREIILTTPIED
jgi:(4S)-4-hydroxy-5-phosphonooxypentane-2,3-dione isomerase